MKSLFLIITCLFISSYSFAQEMIVGGETRSTIGEISPTAKSPEATKAVEEKKKTWLDKYTKILKMADSSRVRDSILWLRATKNLSENLKNLRIEQRKKLVDDQIKRDKTHQMISAYGETYVPHKVAFTSGKEYTTWIRYFDGKVTAVINDTLNDGRNVTPVHWSIQNTEGQDISGSTTPTSVFAEYIRLIYENPIDVQKVFNSTLDELDRFTKYTEKLITVEETPDKENPLVLDDKDATVNEVDKAYDKLVDIASDIEKMGDNDETLLTTKEHSNVNYYDSTTTGGVKDKVKNENIKISTNSAPDSSETQYAEYEYTHEEKHESAQELIIDPYPHHELGYKEKIENKVFTHEAVLKKSTITSTVLGFTTVTTTIRTGLNEFNEFTGWTETMQTDTGASLGENKYSSVIYDNKSNITDYNLESITPNGIKKDIEVRNIEYDSLKRVTKKDVTEKIDSSKWTYNYSDFAYNNLWQITGFNVKITDPNGVITDRVQSGMLYDSKGLLTNVTRVDKTGTETETSNITYAYGDDGLLSEIIYQVTIENGTAKESHYKRWGDFTYNASRQITRYNYVDIKRTGVLEFLDFKTKITDLLSSISDTYPFTTTTLNLASLGFTSSDTVIIQKWNISFASPSQTDILTSAQVEDELARLSVFNSITRTITLITDTITTSNRP